MTPAGDRQPGESGELELDEELEALVERMQNPAATAAGHALFAASPEELGRAAVAAAKGRTVAE